MRIPNLRTLSAAGMIVAAAVGPGAVRATEAQGTTLDSRSALAVNLNCASSITLCSAHATGGSGGYTFAWTNALETYREAGYSEADPDCPPLANVARVRVTVTDGTGATATSPWVTYQCVTQW